MEKIKVIIKRPDEVVGREERIDNTLEAFQEAVGGYIEALAILRNPGVVMVMNEDGKILDLPYNFKIPVDEIRGTVVICGFDGGEFCDLPINWQTWNSILLGWGN